MHPFARQLLGWQADNPERRAAALVLEVKGDFCHDIRRMLAELDRSEDYIELSLDGRLTWNPRRWCRPLRRGGRCLRWSVYDALTYVGMVVRWLRGGPTGCPDAQAPRPAPPAFPCP